MWYLLGAVTPLPRPLWQAVLCLCVAGFFGLVASRHWNVHTQKLDILFQLINYCINFCPEISRKMGSKALDELTLQSDFPIYKLNGFSALCWMVVVTACKWLKAGVVSSHISGIKLPQPHWFTKCHQDMPVSMLEHDIRCQLTGLIRNVQVEMSHVEPEWLCVFPESYSAVCWHFYLQYSECFTSLNKPVESRWFYLHALTGPARTESHNMFSVWVFIEVTCHNTFWPTEWPIVYLH